jgi:hypothetical protein
VLARSSASRLSGRSERCRINAIPGEANAQ